MRVRWNGCNRLGVRTLDLRAPLGAKTVGNQPRCHQENGVSMIDNRTPPWSFLIRRMNKFRCEACTSYDAVEAD